MISMQENKRGGPTRTATPKENKGVTLPHRAETPHCFSKVILRSAPPSRGSPQSGCLPYYRPPVAGNGLWRITPGPNTKRRSSLNGVEIRRFWAPIICRRPWFKFDSVAECCESTYCFACGAEYPQLHAAHIVPVWAGGSNDHSNLHLLCPGCHAISECVGGLRYWRWFKWWGMGKMVRYWNGDADVVACTSRLLGTDNPLNTQHGRRG